MQIDATSGSRQIDLDARLYVAACASCHYNGAGVINPARPDLALNSAAYLSSPNNLVRILVYGSTRPRGRPAS